VQPARCEKIEADTHPSDPEQVKAQVKALIQEPVRDIRTEIVVRHIQSADRNDERNSVDKVGPAPR
jgi:hypothetical protein